MSQAEPKQQASRQVMSNCPQCTASLVVLSVIAGKAGTEYWAMRCRKCGGIHLDIVKPELPAPAILDSSHIFA